MASQAPWGASPVSTPIEEPSVASAVAKEHTIKDIVSLRDGLRGLLVRVTEVEAENEKLGKENEMLAQYMENLTRNSVVAAGAKRTR